MHQPASQENSLLQNCFLALSVKVSSFAFAIYGSHAFPMFKESTESELEVTECTLIGHMNKGIWRYTFRNYCIRNLLCSLISCLLLVSHFGMSATI